MEKLKGMRVDILRPADGFDGSAGGVTSKAISALLVGDEIAPVFEDRGDVPVLKLERRVYGRDYIFAVPVEPKRIGAAGPMAGGNFIYSHDSRFRKISQYPIPVHDRFEVKQAA